MKKIILPLLVVSFVGHVYAQSPTSSAEKKNHIQNSDSNANSKHQSDLELATKNKKIVTDFYNGVFTKHQVKAYSDQYIGERYIQHNPHVPNGKAPFVNYFTQYFKENPQARNTIKSVIAEGDRVVLHVHSTQNNQDRGTAIVDIFRVENGKIVEHWDVQQDIPEQSANSNTMF